jgi:hypothetical protein
VIEFRYADGTFVRGAYEQYVKRQLTKDEALEFNDELWVLRDRKDDNGVTVYVFRTMGDAERLVYERHRGRQHGGHVWRR